MTVEQRQESAKKAKGMAEDAKVGVRNDRKKANDKIEIANIYRFISLIFYNKNDIQKADQYINLAIKTLEEKKINHESYVEDLLQFYYYNNTALSLSLA